MYNIEIKAFPHPSLSFMLLTTPLNELSYCTLEEVKTNLQQQNVTDVMRMSRKKDGETIKKETPTFLLLTCQKSQKN